MLKTCRSIIDDFIDLEAMPNGDTLLLWQEDSTGHIGRANRSGGLIWHTKDFTLSDYARLRRFDTAGKHVTLWPGFKDEELHFQDDPSFKNLADQPGTIPEEAWLMGGPGDMLYIIDRDKGTIICYDRQGKRLDTIKHKLKGVQRIQDCGVALDGSIYILFDHKKYIGDVNFSHVGRISKDSFSILAGPHSKVNNFPLGSDMERLAVAGNGELHLCDYDFNNFRILAGDGRMIWRSPGTIIEDETLVEELASQRGA